MLVFCLHVFDGVCVWGYLLLDMGFCEWAYELCRWFSVEGPWCGVDVNTLRFYL